MKKLLLIEDNEEIRHLIMRFLESDGYEVYFADSIKAARELINSGTTFSAALVDFWLGQNDAVPLIDLLRAKCPDVPILLISGGNGNVSLETTMALGEISGVMGFLQKPFRKSELIERLNAMI
jgi:two-component system phosphate regulon response regulator OmpR